MSTGSGADYVSKWLEHGDSDAKAARALVRSGQHLQALFFVQQSMEKATKALLFAVGASYTQVASQKHDNLDSFLTLNRLIGDTDFVIFALEELFEQETFQELSILHQNAISEGRRNPEELQQEVATHYQQVFRFLRSRVVTRQEKRSFRAQFSTLPPDIVGGMLSLQGNIKNLFTATTGKPFKLRPMPPEADVMSWLVNEIMTQAFSRLPRDKWRKLSEPAKAIIRAFIDGIGESNLREALQEPTQTSVDLHFKWVLAYLNLYIVGTISWPHAVSARYPASPTAADKPVEAAGRNRMGIQHYSDQIGAVVHVEALAQEAEWTTKVLIRCHREGIGLFNNERS